MKRLLLYILLTTVALTSGFAQLPLQFSQVFKSLEFVNPAYSAFRGAPAGKLMYRSQWAGMDGAPKTMGFTGYTPLTNYKLGLGFTGVNVTQGSMVMNNLAATINIDLQVNKTDYIAFGLQGGVEYSYFDKNKLVTYYDIDATDIGGYGYEGIDDFTFVNPAFGVGGIYYSPKFYVGLSSFLMINGNKFLATDFYQGSFLMAGLTQRIFTDWYLKETFLYKAMNNDNNIGELGVTAMYKDLFWIGTSHRYMESQSVILDIKMTDLFRVGMSYDIVLNELERFTYGSFEVRLEYRGISKYRERNAKKRKFNQF